MAGIYFHIPFCKQACHYCDFHFSTSLKYKDEMLQAMQQEIALQSQYLDEHPIETIYFGGGTPSILEADDIQRLVDLIVQHFNVFPVCEITMEANPDDLHAGRVQALKNTSINRFSIGIQSFFEEDLRWMNRAHDAEEAQQAIRCVQDAGFDNITADLIYGYPLLTDSKWQANIDQLLAFNIPHISAYSMTVEPKTALATFIRKGKQAPMNEGQSAVHFEYLAAILTSKGYEHYEIANFAKPGKYALHNSNYWKGVPYLGIGPSAHSFDGDTRQWNVRNNSKYIKALSQGILPFEQEVLSEQDKLNEYIMTSLRTQWGVDFDYVKKHFGAHHYENLHRATERFITHKEVLVHEGKIMLTTKGKLIADYIASELFC